jgi:hypothetical protein
LRPAFVQLILGICFVFRAARNYFVAVACHLRTAVSGNIEGGHSVGGGGGLISGPRSGNDGGYSKNEGTHFDLSVEFMSDFTCSWRKRAQSSVPERVMMRGSGINRELRWPVK